MPDLDRGQAQASTREKIVDNAINLFAVKGFTETSIRELAAASGLKAGSIYNYFPSKNDILNYILNDYATCYAGTIDYEDAAIILKKNPNVEGILSCTRLYFPEGKEEYYKKVLSVLLQEQYRNPVIHDFICKQIILRAEHDIQAILQVLKDTGGIRQDTDLDFWKKMCSSLMYAFSSRMLLGIGDSLPGYTGMGMIDLLKTLLNLMFATCGVQDSTFPR